VPNRPCIQVRQEPTLGGRNTTPVKDKLGGQGEHPSDLDVAAVLLAFYSSARAEALQRLHQRDQGLTLFAAAFGVLAGAAFSRFESRYAIFFIVPFLGLGATFVSMQHDSRLIALGRYCGNELGEHLHRLTNARQWDESASYRRTTHAADRHRLAAHLWLLVGPQYAACAIGMYGLLDHIDRVQAPHLLAVSLAACAGGVPAIYSTLLTIRAYHHRQRWSPY
jgi:hypothetical protein